MQSKGKMHIQLWKETKKGSCHFVHLEAAY